MRKNIAILFSGVGSNAVNIIEKLHKKYNNGIYIEVVKTICNNKDAKGIQKVSDLGVEVELIEHQNFKNRSSFDEKIVATLSQYELDLVVLAGFMRILTKTFTNSINAINLHPSILPLFKGANAIEESFHSGMKIGGVSVHKVGEELDGGDIIAQDSIAIRGDDTLRSFEDRIHKLEHEILPKAILEVLLSQV